MEYHVQNLDIAKFESNAFSPKYSNSRFYAWTTVCGNTVGHEKRIWILDCFFHCVIMDMWSYDALRSRHGNEWHTQHLKVSFLKYEGPSYFISFRWHLFMSKRAWYTPTFNLFKLKYGCFTLRLLIWVDIWDNFFHGISKCIFVLAF